LIFGVTANLGLLGYYKYANFFIESFNMLVGAEQVLHTVILPLAISFFTFQQIAYLADVYRGETREPNFLHYCLFVVFFPQLIAGPIVHHKEMLPQFAQDAVYRLRAEHLAVGFTIFAIGLFKKVMLADGIAVYATNVFVGAENDIAMTFFEAWGGALAYSFQIYFDFSGYSDMAIGLARMFGIRLALNFNSPYKATSIIDFWKRWHITLSRFLLNYLYIPLQGNRKGESRRFMSLMVTMLLGGLWHGAGWTYILWGGLHGVYLVINHGWRKLYGHRKKSKLFEIITWMTTMLAVVVAWVPFRAESIGSAGKILATMAGINKISLPESMAGMFGNTSQSLIEHIFVFEGMFYHGIFGHYPTKGVIWLFVLLCIVCFVPNTQQILHRYRPAHGTRKGGILSLRYRWMGWGPTALWGLVIAGIFIASVVSLTKESEFLYFQF
jgi:alginate O-acetyltransferase complex protein AlgI